MANANRRAENRRWSVSFVNLGSRCGIYCRRIAQTLVNSVPPLRWAQSCAQEHRDDLHDMQSWVSGRISKLHRSEELRPGEYLYFELEQQRAQTSTDPAE